MAAKQSGTAFFVIMRLCADGFFVGAGLFVFLFRIFDERTEFL